MTHWIHRAHSRFTTTMVAVAASALLGLASPVRVGSAETAPRFEELPCWFGAVEARCGLMHVPEDHFDSGSPIIGFPVVIIPANLSFRASRGAVIVLGGGGPGNSVGLTSSTLAYHRDTFKSLLDLGLDLVLMEQRGVGDAVPSTHCPEVVKSNAAVYREDVGEEEEWDRYQGALLACFQRLRDAGVEPSRYDTVQSAEDAESLRRALGYRHWILYGASYAAQIALELAQRHPGGVWAMVLDSPSMPQYRFYAESGRLVDEAIERFLFRCEQQAACGEAHPSLRADLADVLAALQSSPVTLSLDPPLTSKSFAFVLNRPRYIDVLFDALYDPRNLDLLRDAIASASRGDFSPTAPFVSTFLAWQLDETFGDGASVATDCREEVANTHPDEVRVYLEKFSGREQRRSFDRVRSTCGVLRVGVSDPMIKRAPRSVIPALILAGADDPITPLPSVEEGLLQLSGATLVTFENEAHYLLYLPCAQRLVSMWLIGRLQTGSEICTEDGIAVLVRHST